MSKIKKTIYIDKLLANSIEKNFVEIVEYDSFTKFKAFCASESSFFEYLLSLGLRQYIKEKENETKEIY